MIAQYSGVFKKEKLFINDGTPIVSQVYNDPSKLLGEITSENCDAVMKANVGIFKQDQDAINMLKHYVTTKETVGHFIWVILLGSVTIMVSQNALLNENCSRKIEDRKEFKNYLESQLRD
jgi:hypothetical protein